MSDNSGESSNGWRVKLYQLNSGGEWDDRGTGNIQCKFNEVRS
jgi:hypothetical protein